MARPSPLDRLRAHDRRANERSAWRNDTYRYGDYRLRNDENTLGPQEDVLETRRRHHTRVATNHSANTGSAPLSENLLLLGLLAGSIYGLYRLIVYLLSQS